MVEGATMTHGHAITSPSLGLGSIFTRCKKGLIGSLCIPSVEMTRHAAHDLMSGMCRPLPELPKRFLRDARVLVAECFAFLWSLDTPVIVMDIDGTITRSDVPGLLMTISPGIYDHTHGGICGLLARLVGEVILTLEGKGMGGEGGVSYLRGCASTRICVAFAVSRPCDECVCVRG